MRAALPGWPSFAFTDVAAIAFFCTAGASMALFSAAQQGRDRRRRGGRAAVQALVPIGVVLHWLLWRTAELRGARGPGGHRRWPPRPRGAELTAASRGDRRPGGRRVVGLADASHGWLAAEVLGGTFPLVTYLGFVLVGGGGRPHGAARGPALGRRRRVVATGAVLVMAVEGTVPDRYPGEVPFVVPGLAGTVIVYFLVQFRWPAALAGVDSVVRRRAPGLGIFVAHYLLFGLLRRAGVTHALDAATAIPWPWPSRRPCASAPHVPTPMVTPHRPAPGRSPGRQHRHLGLVVAPRPSAEASIASAQQTSSL